MNRRQLLKFTAVLPQTCQQLAQKYNLQATELDIDSGYMVIVSPDNAYQAEDWRWRDRITREIQDCFESAGVARNKIGVLILRQYSIEIIELENDQT